MALALQLGFRPEVPLLRTCGVQPRNCLLHKHAIAVGIEPVALAHSVAVGFEHFFFAGEGAHQHQQRRLRQVKICQQRSYHAEFVAWINKDVGFAASRLRPAGQPIAAAEYSSVLTVVVPTATMRRPASCARLIAVAASAEIEKLSRCSLWSSTRSSRTG